MESVQVYCVKDKQSFDMRAQIFQKENCDLEVVFIDEEIDKKFKGKFPKLTSEMMLDATKSGTYEEFLEMMSIDEHDQIYAPFAMDASPGRKGVAKIKPIEGYFPFKRN